MSRYWILLLIILASLSYANKAAAAWATETEFELVLPANGGQGIKKIAVPSAIIAAAKNSKTFPLKSQALPRAGGNLEEYLKQKFEQPPRPPNNADLNQVLEFFADQVFPQLQTKAAQDAVWQEENGRVINFSPDQAGESFEGLQIINEFAEAVMSERTQLTIAPIELKPYQTLAETNQYGISDLLGLGETGFKGSSANRTQNIRTGSSRYQGVFIKPDETFSFNSHLGPIDGAHGFAPEMVIKRNGIFPEFGGGLCHVSTTMFRAALKAGLPIVERTNHAFPQAYYNPPGTDATIYTGYLDLKFRNDTGNYILIWPEIKGTVLKFNLYGKSDGRRVELALPPTKYDFKSSGAFKTLLKRTITFVDGNQRQDNIVSQYRPASEFIQTSTAQEPIKPLNGPAEAKPEAPNQNPENFSVN